MRGGRLGKHTICRQSALLTVTGAAAALVLVAGSADASIPGTGGLITACYSQATGSMRVINAQSGARCASNEKKLTWNQTGPAGPQGLPGFDGSNGKTVLNGSGAPAGSLGRNGDFYLDTTSEVLYGPKTAGAWPATGVSLVGPRGATGATGPAGPAGDAGPAGPAGDAGPAGPAGDAGPAGPPGATGPAGPAGDAGPAGSQGPAGTNGASVLNGSGAPAGSLGSNGDFYLDTTSEVLYGPKSAGAWPATGVSLVGPRGATGATGAAGPTGPAGAQGPQGPAGTNHGYFASISSNLMTQDTAITVGSTVSLPAGTYFVTMAGDAVAYLNSTGALECQIQGATGNSYAGPNGIPLDGLPTTIAGAAEVVLTAAGSISVSCNYAASNNGDVLLNGAIIVMPVGAVN
jgi:Collagen triple helix repeat (20 copies)